MAEKNITPVPEKLSADLRAAGFTDAAVAFPRDELALALLCAFVGVKPEQAPNGFRYFPNQATAEAWGRVAAAARAHILSELREPTKPMLRAAAKALSPGRRPTPDRVSCREKHRIRFQAMIDAVGEGK